MVCKFLIDCGLRNLVLFLLFFMRFMPGIYSFYKGVDSFLWFCLIALVLRIFMVCFIYFMSFFVNFFLLLVHFIGFSAAFCRS